MKVTLAVALLLSSTKAYASNMFDELDNELNEMLTVKMNRFDSEILDNKERNLHDA